MAMQGSVTTVQEFLARQFGASHVVVTPPRPVTIGTTVTSLLTPDPRRIGLMVLNIGTANAWVLPLSSVAVDSGFPLLGRTSGIQFSVAEDWTMVSSGWWGIALTATTDVLLVEVLLR